MATNMNRFTITVPPETAKSIDELKRNEFYNKPYSEVYRHIINAGVSVIKTAKYRNNKCKTS